MNIKELVNDLDPVTIIEFKNYIVENLMEFCSKKIPIQKYICSGCNHTCSESTNTIICHSKLSFDIWSKVIDNLLDVFSVRRIAEENNISVYTSFRLRHKILLALKSFVKNIKLSGKTQSDEKYFSINLKGTKTENMPRYSKKRMSTSSS